MLSRSMFLWSVELGADATPDLANWAGPECAQPPIGVGGAAKSVKSADSADWLVKRARCVVIFDHWAMMHRTKLRSRSRN